MIKKKVRTYSSTDRENDMLWEVAEYRASNKSATITGLVASEFWRIFPDGTEKVKKTEGAK